MADLEHDRQLARERVRRLTSGVEEDRSSAAATTATVTSTVTTCDSNDGMDK